MRIPSAKVDQNIYFVAQDGYGARLTGLTSFTVVRSRNGAANATYTTPTVTEIGNGVYALLIDEDTTMAANSESEEYCVHITQASMQAVTRTIELYKVDSVLDAAAGVETGFTLRQAVRIMLAALAGKASGLATTTAVYRDVNDSADRITATVDANGNRSAVTLNAA